MHLREQVGEDVRVGEVSDLAVIEVDFVGPAAAKQWPVLGVDSRGVADQQLGDLRFVGIHAGRLADKLDSGQLLNLPESHVND